ncbi:serine protease inhibitor 42Dd-like [Leptopilina boulardi]|uniref:serine protease inhibitor 42Dd-like n=1 Tax=Leptopilina boulardi TaxID=63433 RepID=UPI0021F5E209|nr:serine protease inhibitor 42Dd-like [Leptopilina boulardi]
MGLINMNFTFLLCVVILFTTCQSYSFNPPAVIGMPSEIECIQPFLKEFSNQLYEIASENKAENIVTSPLNIYFALNALTFGARKNTAKELRDSLKLSNHTHCKNSYSRLLYFLEYTWGEGGPLTIKSLNKLYISDKYSINSEFRNSLNNDYLIKPLREVENVNFSNLNNTANSINKWFANETNDAVQEFVKTDDLNNVDSMLLVNYIQFKGVWDGYFEKDRTVDSTFYTTGKNYSMKMMRRVSIFSYGTLKNLNATFIEIPYTNADHILLIILPNSIDGLEELERKLKSTTIEEIRTKGVYYMVDLNLPKFKIENTVEIKDVLQKMGMNEMFNDSANFNGISNSTIFMNKVIDKTVIEVDEGADLPSFYRPGGRLPKSDRTFTANHPFHFKIIKPGSRSGIELFAGNCKKF